MELTKLTEILTHEGEGERLPLTKKLPQYSLFPYKGELTEKGEQFLKKINEKTPNEMKIGKGLSGCYRFKVKNAIVELDVYQDPKNRKKIEINPYIIYQIDTIKKELRHLLSFCYLLSCYLYEVQLQ